MTPERKAREEIDGQLHQTGWAVQSADEMDITAARGVAVREFPLKTGFADYLLYADAKALGTIEAKPEGHTLTGVEPQSSKYSAGLPHFHLPLPFAYESHRCGHSVHQFALGSSTMDVFGLRDRLIDDYSSYIRSFIQIRDDRIQDLVDSELAGGLLWPDPLIQLNPSFEPGYRTDQLVDQSILHEECRRIFRINKESGEGQPLRFHRHQEEAVRVARMGANYVLTTGTSSGKSLAYIVPIVDHVLRRGPGRGIQAIVVYPMNALANSQLGELRKFLGHGYPDGRGPVTFERYTGQEKDEEKQRIMANPPDILLTNYVMLELILTRPDERRTLVQAAQGLHFLVLDELHTYRGRQGADVAMLVRRVRDALNAENLQCVGTSATLAGPGTFDEQRGRVAEVASLLFGAEVRPEHVIGETLRRATPERNMEAPAFVQELTGRLTELDRHPPPDYRGFVSDPLSIWIESTFGVQTDPQSGRLVRAEPRSITGPLGAAPALTRATISTLVQWKCVYSSRTQETVQSSAPETTLN